MINCLSVFGYIHCKTMLFTVTSKVLNYTMAKVCKIQLQRLLLHITTPFNTVTLLKEANATYFEIFGHEIVIFIKHLEYLRGL